MFDNDKTQAMFIFVLLSILLILSRIRTAGDGLDWNFPRSPASAVITKNIHGHISYVEPIFYGDFVQSLQRRLLEYPRRAKQVYRSHDYNIVRRYRRRNKLDEDRSYHLSPVNNDEDEDEEEDEEEEEEDEAEENQDNEENSLNDEGANEETAEQGEEETVAVAARNRVARSGYVPLGEANERERREVARIRSATEECKDKPTEPSQYYEYETEVRNVASHIRREGRRAILAAKILGASLLILLLV